MHNTVTDPNLGSEDIALLLLIDRVEADEGEPGMACPDPGMIERAEKMRSAGLVTHLGLCEVQDENGDLMPGQTAPAYTLTDAGRRLLVSALANTV